MRKGPKPGHLGTPRERFERQVIPEPNSGCWLWMGANSKGYGAFWTGKQQVVATHFALEMAGQPVPKGNIVCHRCDNPSCVNPDHLFVGNAKLNVADKVNKKRHLFGERHCLAKLKDTQVVEIRARRANGETLTSIAADYGVSFPTISMIASRKIWGHLA